MCGRFILKAPADIIAEQFAVCELDEWKPRYNIAPSQPVAAVRATNQAASKRELVWLRWGLIPAWVKAPAIGNRLINARAETLIDKPAFRNAFRRRRCLVVADGFYEWLREGARKTPYFVHMQNDQTFAFAGLWESWEGLNHSVIESCTVITTEANETVRPIHNRMPAILPPADYDLWLDLAVSQPDLLMPLIHPYPSDKMVAYPVGPLVNKPSNDDPGCIKPA